jgi:hypothetical protein
MYIITPSHHQCHSQLDLAIPFVCECMAEVEQGVCHHLVGVWKCKELLPSAELKIVKTSTLSPLLKAKLHVCYLLLYVATTGNTFNIRGVNGAGFLSPVLRTAAAGSSKEVVQTILQAEVGWDAETLRGALSEASSAELLELLLGANPQPWQQEVLADAFAAAAEKGNVVAAEHLLKSVPGYSFHDNQLTRALLRASGTGYGQPLPRGACNSPALVQLLLGAHSFSKASLVPCFPGCKNPVIQQQLLGAPAEPWTAEDLLPAVEGALARSNEKLVQVLTTQVQFTPQQLRPLLLSLHRWQREQYKALLSAVAWSKEVLLEALTRVFYERETVRQLLLAAPEPWAAEELLPTLYAAAAKPEKEDTLYEVLGLEGVQFQLKALKQALALAIKSGHGERIVDKLLSALPGRCSHGFLTSAFKSVPRGRKNAVKALLRNQKWTREQLWELVGNAVSSKKPAVLRKVLVVGQGLPWDRNLLFKGLYDASTGKGSTVLLVSPFAGALAAAAAAQGSSSSKQKQARQKPCKQRGSSSSDVYAQAAAAAHPPGGGAWAAKHFKAALQLASKGRRVNTVRDLLRLPGITWDWRSIKDAWSVAFEKDAKKVIATLLEVPGVWTGARLKEWSKEAAKQGKSNAKALLEGKLQPEQSQQQQGKGQGKGLRTLHLPSLECMLESIL